MPYQVIIRSFIENSKGNISLLDSGSNVIICIYKDTKLCQILSYTYVAPFTKNNLLLLMYFTNKNILKQKQKTV